jgi:hypothetical protein
MVAQHLVLGFDKKVVSLCLTPFSLELLSEGLLPFPHEINTEPSTKAANDAFKKRG